MTLAERNAFGNLILLCVPHHKRVDKDETTYSIGTLDEWKQSREAPGHGALDSIGLSRDELEDAITESIESVKEQIGAALARFERVDAEAAALIRALMQQLTEQRRYVVDPDTAAILLRASRDLVHLQDTASILMKASGNLQGLQDSAAALSRAADKIARSRDR